MKKLNELNLKEKKVIIFDLDGTLIDSIGVWNLVDQQLIYNYSGEKINLEQVQQDRDDFLNNNPSTDIYNAYCEFLIKKYNMNFPDPIELSRIRKDTANEVLKKEVEFKEKASELILELKKRGYTLVLATVTTKNQLEIYYNENKRMLSEMNIKEVFDLITTKEDAKKKKPDPEIYYTIMDYLAVKPNECLIFEDSYTGVLAASKAGIEVVNIYDKYSDKDRRKIVNLADYYIENYQEFIDSCVKKAEEEKTLKLSKVENQQKL